MGNIRIKNCDGRRGRIDRAKFDAATEEQIQAWRTEEGYGDFEMRAVRAVVPAVSLREIRERIGVTQEEFAYRYRLPLRSVQEWEQGRKSPSEATRVLLYAISRDPNGLAKALRP